MTWNPWTSRSRVPVNSLRALATRNCRHSRDLTIVQDSRALPCAADPRAVRRDADVPRGRGTGGAIPLWRAHRPCANHLRRSTLARPDDSANRRSLATAPVDGNNSRDRLGSQPRCCGTVLPPMSPFSRSGGGKLLAGVRGPMVAHGCRTTAGVVRCWSWFNRRSRLHRRSDFCRRDGR